MDLNMEKSERNETQGGEKSMALPFSICGILGLETVNQVPDETNSQSSPSGSSGINEISGSNNSEAENEKGDTTFSI